MAVVRRLTVISAVATCSVALALAAPTAGALPAEAPAPPAGGAGLPLVGETLPLVDKTLPLVGEASPRKAVPAVGEAPPAASAPAVPPAAANDLPGRAGAGTPGDMLAIYNTAIEGLRAFGMQPFLYPTAAAYCLGGTTLGLAPAVAGAVPGPWPKTPLAIPGLDLSAVKSGQTMFTFVPYGLGQDGPDTAGMQVAWVNLTNGRGGVTAMGPLSTVARAMIPAEVPAALRPVAERAVQNFFFAALPMGGVRAVPVDTGQGTVLAAVFGTVENGGNSCFFLPTVGIAEVP